MRGSLPLTFLKSNQGDKEKTKKFTSLFPPVRIVSRLSVIILLVIFSFQSYGHHLKGGWISYQYLGIGSITNTSKYKITVKQYLACGSTDGQIDQQVFLGIYDGVADTLYKNIPVFFDRY